MSTGSPVCLTCGAARKMGQGDANTCAKCYARERRGGLKRAADADRGKRTHNLQVAITKELHNVLVALFPNGAERAAWIRNELRMSTEDIVSRHNWKARQ